LSLWLALIFADMQESCWKVFGVYLVKHLIVIKEKERLFNSCILISVQFSNYYLVIPVLVIEVSFTDLNLLSFPPRDRVFVYFGARKNCKSFLKVPIFNQILKPEATFPNQFDVAQSCSSSIWDPCSSES